MMVCDFREPAEPRLCTIHCVSGAMVAGVDIDGKRKIPIYRRLESAWFGELAQSLGATI
jgi:hypothetical protein